MPVAKPTKTAAKTAAVDSKKTAKKETVVVPAVVPKVADVPEVVADMKDVGGGDAVITNLLEKVCALSNHIKSVQSSLKLLIKEFDKQKKIVEKVQKKKEKAKKSPSGFAKPCKISDELCSFIGVDAGTEMSRTDITRHINSYVKEHNLNNPDNRREFFPDKKLKAILNVKDGEKVTYFILQRLIAHHFPPSAAKLAQATKA